MGPVGNTNFFPLKYILLWPIRFMWPNAQGSQRVKAAALSQKFNLQKDSHITSSICFLGDLLSGCPEINFVDEKITQEIKSSSKIIINLETCLYRHSKNLKLRPTNLFHKMHIKEFTNWLELFKISPEKLIVSIANNHVFDQKLAGLNETLRTLDELKISHIGLDSNIKILAPKIGIISWTQWLNHDYSKNKKILRHQEVLKTNWEKIKQEKNIKTLIGFPHWGWEFCYYPEPEIIHDAHKLINSGIDMLIGGHPHMVQPIEIIKQKICAYSLGNMNGFPMGNFFKNHTKIQHGQIIKVDFAGTQIQAYRARSFSPRGDNIMCDI